MPAIEVFRVQDDEGRGPYRPGFSFHWTDVGHSERNPSIMAEFGVDIVKKRRPGEAMGCAFRTIDQLRAWFSTHELIRLVLLGYSVVKLDADRVIAESPRQLVFTRRRPLRFGGERLVDAVHSHEEDTSR